MLENSLIEKRQYSATSIAQVIAFRELVQMSDAHLHLEWKKEKKSCGQLVSLVVSLLRTCSVLFSSTMVGVQFCLIHSTMGEFGEQVN